MSAHQQAEEVPLHARHQSSQHSERTHERQTQWTLKNKSTKMTPFSEQLHQLPEWNSIKAANYINRTVWQTQVPQSGQWPAFWRRRNFWQQPRMAQLDKPKKDWNLYPNMASSHVTNPPTRPGQLHMAVWKYSCLYLRPSYSSTLKDRGLWFQRDQSNCIVQNRERQGPHVSRNLVKCVRNDSQHLQYRHWTKSAPHFLASVE